MSAATLVGSVHKFVARTIVVLTSRCEKRCRSNENKRETCSAGARTVKISPHQLFVTSDNPEIVSRKGLAKLRSKMIIIIILRNNRNGKDNDRSSKIK